MFLLFLDSSVNVALPAITQGLHSAISSVQWIIIVYLFTRVALLPGLGSAADLFGLKPVFLLGLALYTLGVAAAGFTDSIAQLAGMRAVQGVGTGMVWAAGPALVARAFPYGERGRALGVMTAGGTIGMLSGPLIGGWLLGLWGWPAIFWFRVPLGLVAVGVAWWGVASPPPLSPRPRYDLPGATALAASLALIMLTLGLAGYGYRSPLLPLLGLGGVGLLAGFLLVEARFPTPLLHPSLLRHRLFLVANARAYLGYCAWFVTMFLFPFFMAERLHLSPLMMGMMLTAVPGVASLISPLSGWASDRIGSRWLVSGGLLILTAGLGLLSRFQGGDPALPVLATLMLMGVGYGLFQAPNYNALMGCAPKDRLGTAASLLALATTLGTVTAVSLISAFFNSRQAGYLLLHPEGIAFDLAYRDTVLLFAAIGGLGAVVSLLGGKETSRLSPG